MWLAVVRGCRNHGRAPDPDTADDARDAVVHAWVRSRPRIPPLGRFLCRTYGPLSPVLRPIQSARRNSCLPR